MSIMNKELELFEMTVADLLKSAPSTVSFFISQGTDCVGCRLSHFCTINNVIKTYGLDEESFLAELSKTMIQKH